jgi:hypothetical protein
MKIKLLIALAIAVLFTNYSQAQQLIVTNPVPFGMTNSAQVISSTNLPSFWGGLYEAGQAAVMWFQANPDAVTATNWFVIPYGVYHNGDLGAGVRGYYMVSAYVWTGLGFEYWKTKTAGNQFYSPSASVNFQTQKKLGPVTYMPFATTGLIAPIGGAGSDNHSVQSMVGAGLAIKVYGDIYLAGDVETWSVGGVSYRAGLGGTF